MVKRTVKKVKQKNYSAIKWVFFSAALVTLIINPKLNDPFNAPKLYILMLSGVVVSGYLLFGKNDLTSPKSLLTPLVFIFILIMGIQTLLTDLKYTAIFGEAQRQLGFITYLGFAVFMLATFKFFRYEMKKYLYISVFVLGLFYIVYGLLQYTGNDPFDWINQYNPIIGTLGNPNYTAAFMAMLVTLCFGFMFDRDLSNKIRTLALFTTGALIVIIYLSNARQGLLSVLAGIGCYVTIKIYKKNTKLGLFSLTGLFIGTIFVAAGILQSGPLQKYLYKGSVSLRGHYWRTGLEMLRENFFTGVGIDRYGANFRRYEEASFPLNYGYELISNNAHNVPIQMFATGGFLLGLSYLSLIFVVLYYAFKGFKYLQGGKFNLLNGVFSAWIAFQIQSIVSIDNIGLTIWGWILGGTVVALSTEIDSNSINENNKKIITNSKKNSDFSIRPIFTGILLIFTIILIAKLTQSESVMFKNKTNMNQMNSNGGSTLQSDLSFILDDPFAQPYYKIEAADAFYILNIKDLAISSAKRVVEIDPINPTYLSVLATMQETAANFSEAIKIRITLSEYDPYNVKNYLQLVKLYKQVGDSPSAVKMRDKIIALAPNSETAELAKIEIQ
jgi:O-antigen ligase